MGKDVVFSGERAFYGCSNLEKFNVDKNNATITADGDGVLYSKDMKTVKCYPAGRKGEYYSVDSSAQNIDAFAFYGCKNLKSLYVPKNVLNMANNSVAYYDLTMIVAHNSTAEQYAIDNEIDYIYIDDIGTPDSVRIEPEYGSLPVITAGSGKVSVIGDYNGVPLPVEDYTVDYDPEVSGIQTVTVTCGGQTTEIEVLVYDPEKEAVADFGDVDIAPENRGFVAVYDDDGRMLEVLFPITGDDYTLALVSSDAAEAKLLVVSSDGFVPEMAAPTVELQ